MSWFKIIYPEVRVPRVHFDPSVDHVALVGDVACSRPLGKALSGRGWAREYDQ